MYSTTMERENVYLKCRICLLDIPDSSQAITIFSKDFLDEKIKRYLHVDIDFSDKYPKRLCRSCLIKLDEIHQFACLAQKNQHIFLRYAESLKPSALPQMKLHKTTLLSNGDITIFAYDDLKLGQIIKDHDLLMLILKALKWVDNTSRNINEQLTRLKNSNFQDVLGNPALLQDEDLVQLLGPYTNREPSLSITRHSMNNNSNDGLHLEDDTHITEMEVGVDPDLFFPYEDDETRSAEENLALIREDVKPVLCMECPQIFNSDAELLEHNKLKHDTSVRLVDKRKLPVAIDKTVKQMPVAIPVPVTKVLPCAIPVPAPIIPKLMPPPVIKVPPRVTKPAITRATATKSAAARNIATKPAGTGRPTSAAAVGRTSSSSSSAAGRTVVTKAQTTTPAPIIPVTLPASTTVTAVEKKKSHPDSVAINAVSRRSQTISKRTRLKPLTSRFSCTQCGKKLSTKGNLKVHLETHKPKGKFSCDKCGRIFKTYLNLARHRKYHSGEKFACPTCARVYPTNSTLRAHVITHSNIRPHECPICFKTFKRNQDLKFHINQHTGDKPYKCPFCPKAFASSGNCFSHRKRMHSDKT